MATDGHPLSTDDQFQIAMVRRQQRLVWVRVLRLALPGMAALLIVALLGQALWRTVMSLLHPAPAVAEQGMRMARPEFSGVGRDGSRYRLTAQSGVRDTTDDKRILLQRPVITVSRTGQADTHTLADHGVFREDDRTLRLTGNVQVEGASGYQFATNDAVIDTATGKVMGQAVQGQGASGRVRSNSYAVSDKGDRMVFKGRVRARINEH